MSPRAAMGAAATIARTYGARGAWLRAIHEARRGAGAFRRNSRTRVIPAPARQPFSVRLDRIASAASRDAALDRARHVLDGHYLAYGHARRPLPTDAHGWHVNPVTGYAYDERQPWWRIPHVLPAAGDIKDVWEPARFSFVYDLVRAYAVTADPVYVRAFERHFGTWWESSPPFSGVHWSCGQETTVRAIALLYAEAAFSEAMSASTRQALVDVLAASGERIADAIGYAISQRNNHGISEAAGLVALGARFEELHPDASRWRARGHAWLESLVCEQFARDGWYIQHSFNYLRVALDQCVVAERALRVAGTSLSANVAGRIRAACQLLIEVMNSSDGAVPNHGANDGALVHPIAAADWRDFRPALTAACAMFGHPLPADLQPNAETLAWLGVDVPPRSPSRADGAVRGESGWAVARMGGTSVFLRAGSYQSRPGHMDALQVDIRLGGQDVIVDPGTFAYMAPPPWNNGLAAGRVHNGPLPDGREPGLRGPRFLWLQWPTAKLDAVTMDEGRATLVAQMRGVRRTVAITRDDVTVTDERLSPARTLRICWLLSPGATASAECSVPHRVMHAGADDTTGWYSPRYGERIASRALVVETSSPVVTWRFSAGKDA